MLWRHCHGDHCEVHDMHQDSHASKDHQHTHDAGRSGSMIMVGDLFHNFVDGILIGSAFMVSTSCRYRDSVSDYCARDPSRSR